MTNPKRGRRLVVPDFFNFIIIEVTVLHKFLGHCDMQCDYAFYTLETQALKRS